jgi:hypothetical protein
LWLGRSERFGAGVLFWIEAWLRRNGVADVAAAVKAVTTRTTATVVVVEAAAAVVEEADDVSDLDTIKVAAAIDRPAFRPSKSFKRTANRCLSNLPAAS